VILIISQSGTGYHRHTLGNRFYLP